MLISYKMPNGIQRMILRFPKLILMCNVGLWFVIGMLLSSIFVILPLFDSVEIFHDQVSLASLLAILFGFIGGILVLVKMDPDKDDIKEELEKDSIKIGE